MFMYEELFNPFADEVNYIIVPLSKAAKGLYLIGGYVYRNIISRLYNIDAWNKHDVDFIAAEFYLEKLPINWLVEEHGVKGLPDSCKGWKITTNEGKIFDISIFRKHACSVLTKENPDINSYLKNVPLSIQSIAYDVENKKVLGNEGIKSIKERKFWYNNKNNVLFDGDYWQKKIEKIEEELGFEFIEQ